MYFYRLFVLAIVVSIFASCKTLLHPKPKPSITTTPVAVIPPPDTTPLVISPSPPDTVAVIPAPPPINYDTVLVATLLRTPCYGHCPHYDLKFYASGLVSYEGIAHVDSIGWFEGRLDSLDMVQLIQHAQKIGYPDLADAYPQQGKSIPDLPLTVSSLHYNGKHKIIYNRLEAPKILLQYERYLDTLQAKITHWNRKE